MRYVMLVLGIIALVGGVGIFTNARSAIHEIEALICVLIGVCGLGFAGVIEATRK